jgi:FixJ family two-component response regulator
MPGMSGVELAQKVRGRDPMMPVVLASGYSEEILQGAGAEFEMLRKPFDSTSVMSAITAAVRQVEARSGSSAPPASDLSRRVGSD